MATTSSGAPLEPTIPSARPEVSPAPQISPLIARKAARPGTNTILMAAAVFVAVAGVAFAAGRLTAPAASAASRFGGNGTFAGASGNGNGNGAGGGGANGSGLRGIGGGGVTVSGIVTAVGNGTLTLQTANGASITVDTTSGTTYHAQTAATASQVAVGTKVLVRTTFGRPAGAGAAGGTQPLPGATGGPAAGSGPATGSGPFGGFENRTFTASDVTIAQ